MNLIIYLIDPCYNCTSAVKSRNHLALSASVVKSCKFSSRFDVIVEVDYQCFSLWFSSSYFFQLIFIIENTK